MERDREGRFVVFEGIDGSGKSTQIRLLAEKIRSLGHMPYETFEPTDGPVGVLIRQMLSGEVKTDQRTIASLFAADRTDHLMNEKNGISHKVKTGGIVLCDRYYFSSYAYHAQYIDMKWVIQANALNAEELRPDITVFIDVEPQRCFERIQQRGDGLEMYEKIDIMEKVRTNYFLAFERLKQQETVVIVDGNADVEAVARNVWAKTGHLFEK